MPHSPRLLLAILLLFALGRGVDAAPPMTGTIFMDPDIITPADPTAFVALTYVGTGARLMFDRRTNSFVTYQAFLFQAAYADNRSIEVQVNPEFGSAAAAQTYAEVYARLAGQLPAALRADVQTMWIHAGNYDLGGGNNNLLIHIGRADEYQGAGILEETLVHEAAHTSLDAAHANAAGWRAAQAADPDFISTYARDNASREDVAESVLPYFAVRYRRDRISPSLAATIETAIPNRLAYFDQQGFALFPFGGGGGSSTLTPPALSAAAVNGTTVTLSWQAVAGAGTGFRVEAGSAPGLANLAAIVINPSLRSISFSGVPPGTYYVRMRSVGSGTASTASNEITVVVGGNGCSVAGAAQQLTATVRAREVTLSWTLTDPSVTAIDIEAGSAAGLTNLAVLQLPGTARTFSVIAPPGTYYVRVRARNACSAGTASNEVVIVVP